MKTTMHSVLLVACLGVLGNTYAAPPSDAPPKVENLDPSTYPSDPAVTRQKKTSSNQITHTIQNGEQTEVKVTNGVGTYIVKPNQSVGNSQPGDAQSSTNHPAQWVIKSWGGIKSTEPTADEQPPELPPNPHPEPRK